VIKPGEVHVWQIPLDRDPAAAQACLDASERCRAAAFKFDIDRRRFIVAHAALRQILARYAGAEPAALVFETDAHGKPRLAHGTWQFNLSHSDDLALLAVACDQALGVDVEMQRSFKRGAEDDGWDEEMALAARHFTPREAQRLRALQGAERTHAFFRCWTRKEACVKAIGTGIRTDLRDIEVGFDGEARVGVLHVQTLNLTAALAVRGYVAALATALEPGNIGLLSLA
jgi:4'-phosphopantetheinyl transferase